MNAITTLHARRPVSIRPISSTGMRAMSGDRRATLAGAEANYLYITRGHGTDARGPLDYRARGDLVAHGLQLPPRHPCWATEPGRIRRELDRIMAGEAPDAISAWHVVVSLPDDRESDCWVHMVREYAATTIAQHGPAVAWAIHFRPRSSPEGPIAPHAHLLLTTRRWKRGARQGETVKTWCGPAIRARLYGNWLARLPATMRVEAASPYRCGNWLPAMPDCSAIAHLFPPVGWSTA